MKQDDSLGESDRSLMNRIGHWLPRALFESFFVVISILTALAVNEWRDHRARLARMAEARSAFVHEIESNVKLLGSAMYLPHHKKLEDEYRELSAAESAERGSLFQTGAHPTPLREAAWRSLSSSGTLVDFAPAEVILLTDIYRVQEDLQRLNSNTMAQLNAPRSDRETLEYKRDETRAISMYLNDVVPQEERLQKIYEHALETLKAGPKP